MSDAAGADKRPVDEPESLIEYPVDFPVKVMGKTQPGFAQQMLAIIKKHAPDFDESTVGMRSSREGKFLSLTFTIRAVSRQQLDALYQDLSDHPMVQMAL
jgi:putative lipoic acid-binding regulatory protein